MASKKTPLTQHSSNQEIDAFLNQVNTTPKPGSGGRLLFALDATASRETTWDQASHIQAQMFEETSTLGGLEIQLAYFRGYGEFETSTWTRNTQQLLRYMTDVHCLAGLTQIERLLSHATASSREQHIDALVFVGDCMEEPTTSIENLAGELGILGTPAFMFQEGFDPTAEQSFQRIAALSRGAYCRFDANSPQQLRDLLKAVAIYAAGGHKALAKFRSNHPELVKQLTRQIGAD